MASADLRLNLEKLLRWLAPCCALLLAGCSVLDTGLPNFGRSSAPASQRSDLPPVQRDPAARAPAERSDSAPAPSPQPQQPPQAASAPAPEPKGLPPAPTPITPAARAPEQPVDPAVQRAFDAAREALAAGRIADAERGFVALAKSNPELAGPHANLALIQRRNGKHAEAVSGLEKAVQLNPQSAELHNQLGISYREAGDFAKARAAYERAIALDARHSHAQLNLGILHDLYLANFQQALDQYERYLALVPDDAEVRRWLADLRNRMAPKPAARKE